MRAAAKTIAGTWGHEDAIHQFAGMLIVSLFPALFWTLTAAGVAAAVGQSLSPAALLAAGTAIAAFCATVFHALLAQR